MPVYDYTALDLKGKSVSGVIDAESSAAARQKLRLLKTFPVSVAEVQGPVGAQRVKPPGGLLHLVRRVNTAEIAMLTRQLATLLGAGLPLVAAIDSLIPQTRSHFLKKNLVQIKDAIVAGNGFAATLAQHPDIFPPFYVNMAQAGESSGTLEIVLERLADITEKQQALRQRISAAMAYPLLMTFVGALVLFLLLTFIVPSITGIFEDMHQVLPTPTVLLIAASEFLTSFWWAILLALGTGLVAVRHFKKTPKGRFFWDKLMLRLPGVGLLFKKLAAARFARTLGSLLENGVPMLSALSIVKNISGNSVMAGVIEAGATAVGKGQGLAAALKDDDVFPPLAVQMIQVGENSGELEAMLTKTADVFEREAETSLLRLTSLLEPMMILLMGVIVGFIVLSICLPIFEMNQLVR